MNELVRAVLQQVFVLSVMCPVLVLVTGFSVFPEVGSDLVCSDVECGPQIQDVLRNSAALYKQQQQHGTEIFSRADHEGVLLAVAASVSGRARAGSARVSGASAGVQRSRGSSDATA